MASRKELPSYDEVATAAGAWLYSMRLPAASLAAIRSELTQLTRRTGWPISAAVTGTAKAEATALLLYRDPSKSFGTPSLTTCTAGAEALAAATGWTLDPAGAPLAGIVVGLGLRRGYTPDAVQHQPAEAVALLAEHGPVLASWPARLVSARQTGDGVRWYAEDGVLVHAGAEMAPAIAVVAGVLGQYRFVITDLSAGRTTAHAQSQHTCGAGGHLHGKESR